MKDYKRLTYKLDEPIKTKYLNYKYMKIADYDVDRGNNGRITDDMLYNKLGELEDKIENGRLVDCIWFISWLNESVCCGQVVGYEEDSGFVILTKGSMVSADKIWTNCEDAEKELLKRKIKELDEDEYQELKQQSRTIDDSFDCGYHEYAKEKHEKRLAENPDRIAFAIKQFENNNIEYTLKNEATGHFHCRRKFDDKLFQFYAGTGKIVGVSNKRGIHEFIKILSNREK